MEKYHYKYRVRSNRLKDWDYSSPGLYFVTICVRDKTNRFGQIMDGAIYLSEIGKTAFEYWKDIPAHYPFVTLDEFVVMPNHVHGIIVINPKHPVELQSPTSLSPTMLVETQDLASLQPNKTRENSQNIASLQNNKFGPQSRNLGSIIRGFKIGVKKWSRMNRVDFQWQSGFYEHIIRNEKSLQSIRQYIIDNPLKWKLDTENPEVKPL